jgi:hypothetical protein
MLVVLNSLWLVPRLRSNRQHADKELYLTLRDDMNKDSYYKLLSTKLAQCHVRGRPRRVRT